MRTRTTPGPERLRIAGVTMVELLVTLTILAVLTTLAVPLFTSTMRRSNVTNAINSLSSDIQFARGEAASQHRFVSICRSTTGTTCAAGASSPYDYDVGWMVYSYDVTAKGSNQSYSGTSGNMQILRVTRQLKGASLRATDTDVITFNQTGQFVTSGTRTQLQFAACARTGTADISNTLGTNQAGIQGSLLTLRASGSVAVTPLALSAKCDF